MCGLMHAYVQQAPIQGNIFYTLNVRIKKIDTYKQVSYLVFNCIIIQMQK